MPVSCSCVGVEGPHSAPPCLSFRVPICWRSWPRSPLECDRLHAHGIDSPGHSLFVVGDAKECGLHIRRDHDPGIGSRREYGRVQCREIRRKYLKYI